MKTKNITKANKNKKRKIIYGLGYLLTNYIDKTALLEMILRFLSEKLEGIYNKEYINKKNLVKKIGNDILRISKYKKINKIEFYFICKNIFDHY